MDKIDLDYSDILVIISFHLVEQNLFLMLVYKYVIVIEKYMLLIVDEHVEMRQLIQQFVEYHRMKNLINKKEIILLSYKS